MIRCCECEGIIPGDQWYFEIEGNYYCEDCIKCHRYLAPFAGEEF